ncbi:NADH oxidase [Anoxybacter fermentans]|uniref:NADH oxidase n=2 Tax=Anoxybacter fermentans TaxID=1323375 RepID=A0A3Q9HT54_9FIRM|nr:NADH oxidase [Anoxybacter fermentans]
MNLKNRIVLPPMATEKATEKGEVTPELIEHYYRYARAGVGLIIIEHSYISPEGKHSPRQLSVANDGVVEGLSKLAEAIHDAGGIAGVQINHTGMAGKPEIVGRPVGPSPFRHPRREECMQARELSREEIKALVKAFAQAAGRVKRAGFDMVEIHSAHGYLINQFNSPLTNHRTDEYGGSLEKRFTFACEVVEAVRREVGPDFPVFFRLGADDLMEGGLTLEDSKKVAPLLVEAGVDLLDLSGGIGGYRVEGKQGYFTYLTERLKEVVDVPLITTGGIIDPEVANQIILDGKADLVGVGRAMLKDYEWATKAISKLS